MLSRRKRVHVAARNPVPAARPCTVSVMRIVDHAPGNTTLDTAGNLIVHGTLSGPIAHDRDVTIASSGRVDGKIRAKVIVVEGEVNGDLHATDLIRVTAEGRVRGDLHAARVGVLRGARLQGRIFMRHRPDHAQALDDPSVHRLLTQL